MDPDGGSQPGPSEGATNAQAEDQLRACEEQLAKGTFLPIKEVPKFSEIAAQWLEYKWAKIRETTWEVYEGHIRNHFDDLKGLLLNRITIATVEKVITERQAKGMNLGTLRKILVTLRASCKSLFGVDFLKNSASSALLC